MLAASCTSLASKGMDIYVTRTRVERTETWVDMSEKKRKRMKVKSLLQAGGGVSTE